MLNCNHVEKIESFINGFLIGKTGVKLYSVEVLGGHDSGKIRATFVKRMGEANSPVHFSETFIYRT